MKLEIIIATPDPYITGLLFGYASALQSITMPVPVKLLVIPNFMKKIPDIFWEFELSLRLFNLFFVIFWLIFHIRLIKLIKFIKEVKN